MSVDDEMVEAADRLRTADRVRLPDADLAQVERRGEPSQIDFVSVTPQGDAYGDADLDVVIYEYQWNSVYARGSDGTFHWETSVNRTPVYTTTMTTDSDGMAENGRILAWFEDLPERGDS